MKYSRLEISITGQARQYQPLKAGLAVELSHDDELGSVINQTVNDLQLALKEAAKVDVLSQDRIHRDELPPEGESTSVVSEPPKTEEKKEVSPPGVKKKRGRPSKKAPPPPPEPPKEPPAIENLQTEEPANSVKKAGSITTDTKLSGSETLPELRDKLLSNFCMIGNKLTPAERKKIFKEYLGVDSQIELHREDCAVTKEQYLSAIRALRR